MSEHMQPRDDRATIRWKLLTTASVIALTASASAASAGDSDHVPLWIELGGQMEQVQGTTGAFVAPFMLLNSSADVYQGIGFISGQKPARYSFGAEAKITFQPDDSDWIFSAGVRYGRSHANRHKHKQQAAAGVPYDVSFTYSGNPYTYVGTKYFTKLASVADTQSENKEQHAVLDFTAGKDVGLGLFGHSGTSQIDAGVRFASFTANSSAYMSGRPEINHTTILKYGLFPFIRPTYFQYTMSARAERSFKGVGPTLSWNASAALLGNAQDGEFMLEWGINGALLFGKQKAKTFHSTRAYHLTATYAHYPLAYPTRTNHSTRSRSVTVPNIGAFAGLSYRYSDAKISFGYRYDTFLNAMDTGIDTAKKSNVTFNGPYASISVGLGD